MEMEVDFAYKRGLEGLMAWAIDIDDEEGDPIGALSGSELKDEDDILQVMTNNGASIAHGTADGTKCKISECGKDGVQPTCDQVTYLETVAIGTDINGKSRCNMNNSDEARMICCPSFSGPQEEDYQWHDERSTVSEYDCSAKYDIREINMIIDSLGWTGNVTDGSYANRCHRGWKSFCCKAGIMQRCLNICTWTQCGEQCPSDKPQELTTGTRG
jgi:chitinase